MIFEIYNSMQPTDMVNLLMGKDIIIQTQNDQIHALQEKYTDVQFQLNQMKRLIYGTKSDRFIPSGPVPGQAELFPPSLVENGKKEDNQPVKELITYTRDRRTSVNPPFRQPLPSNLRRIVNVIEPEGDLTGKQKIGEEISEVLEYIKPEIIVIQTVRPKYVDPNNESSGVMIGQLPSCPLPKSKIAAGFITYLLVSKYVDHLPVHRIIQMFKRSGIDLPESTVCDWIRDGINLIEILFQLHCKLVLGGNYLQVDETPIPVLDRSKKGKTHRGYYWLYHDPISRLILFEYNPGRAQNVPLTTLKKFTGHLQSDGYNVYEIFEKQKGVILLGCMAHARRYFTEAIDNDPKHAEYALMEFGKLYKIEEECRRETLDFSERKQKRIAEAKPVLDAMKIWMKETLMKVLPKSAIGRALTYSLSRWDKLNIYLTDGKLEIDNNLAENKMRPIAIGRKNYNFAGSHEAARRAGIIYSLFATCKAHNINPEEWLKDVLNRLPDHSIQKLEELLPHLWKPAQSSAKALIPKV